MARSSRAWGWHELNPAWARRLVADADLPARALVLDIGAGHGALTAALVDAGARVIAVELHRARAAALRERFGGTVKVVRADAGDLRLPTRPFHVVANPPFSITSPLLRRLLAPGSRLVSARLVLQHDAVMRWTSPRAPAYRRWSRHHVSGVGPRVPRRAFSPAPGVDTRILRIQRR